MPDIVFQHIVSCSSEDPHYLAKNLLLSNRKWRTLKDGDSKATVIIQLEKETKISKVDIGNNGSAFVEVLVGKSSAPDSKYEVLLLNSSFMTPSESRGGTDTGRVRMFDRDKLDQETVKGKWDRIQIVCQQTFNPHAQFGLSFIRMQSPAEASPGSLGRFQLRDEEEDNFVPGSLFARRKDVPVTSPSKVSAAAAISEASDSSPFLAGKTKAAVIIPKKREHPQNGNTPEAKRRLVQSPATSSAGSPAERKVGKYRKALEGHSDEEEEKKEENEKPKKEEKKAATPKAAKVDPKMSKDKKPVDQPKTTDPKPGIKKAKKKVPFDQLLKGVTIVLSGFQNPTRGILRDNAVDMGAKYKADWDKNCTHLIAAFANTPKVKQVKAMGNGKVVTKEWIDQCFRKRIRFPWRRFALEKEEQDESESEDEILEDTEDAAGPSRVAVIEEPVDEIIIEEDDDEPNLSPKTEFSGKDEYDDETDKDSDDAEVANWPKLPEFYKGLSFSLHEELSDELKKKLKRYIIAAKGKIEDDLNYRVKFLLTESKEGLSELQEFYPDIKAVDPKWIWESFNNNRLAPFDKFLLKA